jgi:hypothetical protein
MRCARAQKVHAAALYLIEGTCSDEGDAGIDNEEALAAATASPRASIPLSRCMEKSAYAFTIVFSPVSAAAAADDAAKKGPLGTHDLVNVIVDRSQFGYCLGEG